MKTNKITDERIVLQNRKINSDAFSLLYIGLILSILIQQFLFQAPLSQYASEAILFLGISVYLIIRNVTAGNYLYGEGKSKWKMILINAFSGSVGVTVAMMVNYSLSDSKKNPAVSPYLIGLLIFLISFIAAFLFGLFLNRWNQKKIQEIEKKYQDDEENN